MKLLVNDKEIANYLSNLIDVRKLVKDIEIKNDNVESVVGWLLEKTSRPGSDISKYKLKFKEKLTTAVRKDLKNYVDEVRAVIQNYKESSYHSIHKHTDYFLKKLDEKYVFDQYRKSNATGFIKSVGLYLDPSAELVRRENFNLIDEDCLLRNTVGNESLIVNKIDNKKPFWFIDSGYTNFLEPNKKWHRLVHNHLHHDNQFSAPVDRLGNFKSFPHQWRTGGDRILIIEPGPFAANIFHVDTKTWKYKVEEELRKYTDKKIIFREKAPKKKREPLYQHLLNEDYYCVVNINSNAATESIWAGIPTITLDRHITNSVSRNTLSEINNLYRGSLAEWLAYLSYSQFTYDELIDGTAVNIFRKFHG